MSNFKFENKTILILSPEKWGKMKLSKHHYAIELANKQNEVYFMVLDQDVRNIEVEKTEFENLFVIKYNTSFPYKIKFHFRRLFDFLMKFQINLILKKIAKPVDVLWCFDFNLYSNLNYFKAKLKIYHPVDPVNFDYQINPAKTADFIFSISEKILSNFLHIDKPQKMINHGVEKHFEELAKNTYTSKKVNRVTVGYFGNLLRPIIDRNFIKTIIEENPKLEYHFWGPLNSASSNIGGNSDKEVVDFISFLKNSSNVVLHGVAKKEDLISSIVENKIDVFILVYKFASSSDRSNAHKLIEYMATGKVTVANQFSTYKDFDDLIVMPKDDDDAKLPALFKKVINNLDYYNSPELQQKRIEFALDNTYEKQIERIEKIISKQINA